MEVNLSELNMGNTAESVQRFLESQKNLFHRQIDLLQEIVVTQCKLTGVNPLSQEMAAGALSIKIGKRPRDLLNPKAVKYMQSVFSIKDVISKKESREISALFGVTVTQVRDFFTSQRSRVRKVVRLSREKSIISNAIEAPQTGVSTSFEPMPTINPLPLNTFGVTNVDEAPIPLDSVSLTSVEENSVPLNSVCITSVDEALVPLNSFGPTSVEEALIPMNIVFPPNVEGAPIPLNTVDPTSVGEAPSCPTQDEALPGIDGADKHFVENIFSLMRKEETFSGQVKLMEWILQIQNSLVLNWFLMKGGVMILATWLSEAATEEQTSVLFVILKVLCHLPLHKALPVHMSVILQSVNRLRFYRTSGLSNRARQLLARWSKIFARAQAVKKPNGMKSYIDEQKEIMLNQSISQVMAEETWHSKINTPEEFALSHENLENSRNLEPQKAMKLLPSSADDQSMKNIRGSRERRKILLVEQPGQKSGGRSQQVTRAGPASQGRPMSADDIQKAKMRAQFMQTKHGKTNGVKNEGLSKPIAIQASASHLASKVLLRPPVEEYKKPVTVAANTKPSLDPKESLLEGCTRVQIPWQTPPEVIISSEWGVGVGENSKEVEIQKNRLCRERETIYQKIHEIPHNPKNPWDNEMDYDDSLTPEIPTEQPPDPDNALTETSLIPEYENRTIDTISGVSSLATGSRSEPHQASTGAPEPDLELLAVLLKNPDLVFALTSGQAGNMSSEDTVRLLDMIKNNAGGLLNGLSGKAKVEERVEVSLPSPTPLSEPGTSGWRPEVNNNPFSKHTAMENHPSITRPQQVTNVPQLQQHFHTSIPSYQTTIIPERSRFANNALEYQNDLDNLTLHSPTPATRNYAGEAWLPRQVESSNNVKPSTISISMNASDRTPIQFSLPHPIPENPHLLPSYNRQTENLEPWRARQSLGSNPYTHQLDQNNYRGPGPSRERNEYVDEDEFEHWGPDGRYNKIKPQGNISHFGRPQNSSGYQDHGMHDNRRWRGHDQRR